MDIPVQTSATTQPPVKAKAPFSYKKILIFGGIFIAAILPVIFFVSSFKDTDADITRIAHLSLTKEKMDDALRRGINLPLPTNAIGLTFGNVKIGYQGRAGKDLFLALGLEFLKDPGTGEMYHYFIRPDTKEYEIVALLDDSKYANFKVGDTPAYSLGTSKGHVLVMNSGKNKGQLISSVINISQTIDISNEQKRTQIGWHAEKSCKDILENQPTSSSGKYVIEMGDKLLTVFCDMRTDKGGWTLFYANNGHPNSDIKMSYIDLRDALKDQPIDNIADYDNPNLVGLIDYKKLTELGAREILIRNKTGNPTSWVKFSFSASNILNWALGEKVLSRSNNKGCTNIPGGGTWSIINQDGKIKYDNLVSIMNQKGAGWGVSQQNYWCNDFVGNANPNLAFYSAGDVTNAGRTRGTDGIGGAWGGENEYRYFIR